MVLKTPRLHRAMELDGSKNGCHALTLNIKCHHCLPFNNFASSHYLNWFCVISCQCLCKKRIFRNRSEIVQNTIFEKNHRENYLYQKKLNIKKKKGKIKIQRQNTIHGTLILSFHWPPIYPDLSSTYNFFLKDLAVQKIVSTLKQRAQLSLLLQF